MSKLVFMLLLFVTLNYSAMAIDDIALYYYKIIKTYAIEGYEDVAQLVEPDIWNAQEYYYRILMEYRHLGLEKKVLDKYKAASWEDFFINKYDFQEKYSEWVSKDKYKEGK